MAHNIVELMREVNGATFISLCTRAEPPLKKAKTTPYAGRIHKVILDSNVMVFQNKKINGYEAMIHRRLIQEGKNPASFELSERAWGNRLRNTPFVEHKGQYYLEVIFLRCGRVFYTLDNMEIEKQAIVEHLAEYPGEAAQGGLDNKVILRTFKIDSITSLTINKEKYEDLFVKF